MSECRHCGKEQATPQIRILVKRGSETSYFYYPDTSCHNDGDGMKQSIDYIDGLRNSGREYSISIQELKGGKFVNCVTDEGGQK